MNKILKIVGFYFLGIICLVLYFYIDNSNELSIFLQKADRVKVNWGFGFYAIVGLLKLTSLIAGLAIPIILTFMLLRQKK
jgi:hypothetical protein